MTVAAQPNSSTFRYCRNPPVIGEVRHKTWACLIAPSGPTDPLWAKRCKDYWELQQETYGLKFSNFTMDVEFENGLAYLTTWAILLDVLPGRRSRDYKAPRTRA